MIQKQTLISSKSQKWDNLIGLNCGKPYRRLSNDFTTAFLLGFSFFINTAERFGHFVERVDLVLEVQPLSLSVFGPLSYFMKVLCCLMPF